MGKMWIAYVLASLWGILTVSDLVMNPYDITGLSTLAIFNIVFSVSITIALPFGIIWSYSQYKKHKMKTIKMN